MDNQPLLRVNTARPQAASTKAGSTQDGSVRDSGDFKQQLQDQMQSRDNTVASQQDAVKAAESVTRTDRQRIAEQEQQDADSADENVEAVIAPLDLITSVIIGMAGAESVVNAEQELPEGGNILPLLMADESVDIVLPVVNGLPAAVAVISMTDASKQPEQVETILTQLTRTAASQLKHEVAADSSQLHVPAQDTESLAAFLPADTMKLSIKSADVTSDQQIASMVQEAAKATVVSLQQVQAITGSAAANIQTYVPPQFDAGQVTSALSGSVHTAVNHPAWGDRVGEQLAFMIQGKFHSAEIKLNPAHLGPLEVHVSMQDDQASVRFVSAHAPVREALDAAIPRLRDMMEQQGLNLVNVDVSAQSGGQREAFKQPLQNEQSAAVDDRSADVSTVVHAHIASGLSVFV